MEEDIYRPSEQLVDLVFAALEHGFLTICEGEGSLVPFVLTENGDSRTLHRCLAEDFESSRAMAYGVVEQADPEVSRYAIALDGYIMYEGKKWDALIVEAGERGQVSGATFCLRYQEADGGPTRYEIVGNPAYMDTPQLRFKRILAE